MIEDDLYAIGNASFLQNEEDSEWAMKVSNNITFYVTTPMAVIGIVLNSLVLFAWKTYHITFKKIIFLFKALAVADIVFLSCLCIWLYLLEKTTTKAVIGWMAFTARDVLVNINFLVTFIRWVAVMFPFTFRASCHGLRTDLILCFIIFVCGLAELVNLLLEELHLVSETAVILTHVIFVQIILTLPLVVQAVFSASIVWITWRVSRRIQSGWIAHMPGDSELKKRKKVAKLAFGHQRQLTTIIITITIVTFVAYPVSNTVRTYVKLVPAAFKVSSKKFIYACINLMTVINSAINFFIYYRYIPEFRNNLRHQLCRYEEKRQSRTMTAVVSATATAYADVHSMFL